MSSDRIVIHGDDDSSEAHGISCARRVRRAPLEKGAMTATHSRMPDFQLGARDQDDLVAYILSLRPQ